MTSATPIRYTNKLSLIFMRNRIDLHINLWFGQRASDYATGVFAVATGKASDQADMVPTELSVGNQLSIAIRVEEVLKGR